ncbi:MAG: hypothetical protein K9M11_00460 [Candidatus Pacebacteria bacterium]|nr:hypothetical protein [Candidatus Paceibacterota bacterium]
MSYNIHPIFVHFPIALLFVYSVIKILPFKKWFPSVAWHDIEGALLFVGVFGAFGALATGDTAEHLTHPNRQLVDMHSTFGAASTWLYGSLLLGEISAFINARTYTSRYAFFAKYPVVVKILALLEQVFCNRVFSSILALVALITLSITGVLGGVLAYGLTADPFAATLVSWLGITL